MFIKRCRYCDSFMDELKCAFYASMLFAQVMCMVVVAFAVLGGIVLLIDTGSLKAGIAIAALLIYWLILHDNC